MSTKTVRLILAAAAATMLCAGPAANATPKKAKHKAAPAPRHVILDPLAPTPPPPPLPITDSDWRTPDPDNLLVIDTTKGRIIVELYPEVAPDSVARIKTLARQHFYDGQSFFRVIEGFMDQTGDPKNDGTGGSTQPDLKGEFTFRRDHSLPMTTVAVPSGAQVGFIGALPVESQPDLLMAMTTDGKASAWPLFCPGVMAMARGAGPDSANSQFFLMRGPYPALEQRYAGFGRVVAGQDVVDAIKTGEPVPRSSGQDDPGAPRRRPAPRRERQRSRARPQQGRLQGAGGADQGR